MAVRCKWCRIPLFWFGGHQAKGSRVAPFGNWGWFSSRVIFKIRPFFDAFQLPPSEGGAVGILPNVGRPRPATSFWTLEAFVRSTSVRRRRTSGRGTQATASYQSNLAGPRQSEAAVVP